MAGQAESLGAALAQPNTEIDLNIDLLPYVKGRDRATRDLALSWIPNGWQRVQTIHKSDGRWLTVKFEQWEELFADDAFIYRGYDTSPGNGEVYTLKDADPPNPYSHGSRWLPRRMTPGQVYRRKPTVVYFDRTTGAEKRRGEHETWAKLEAVHPRWTTSGGLVLRDVAEVRVYLADPATNPNAQPWETTWFQKDRGMVAWRGEIGESVLTFDWPDGKGPALEPEKLSWLDPSNLPTITTPAPVGPVDPGDGNEIALHGVVQTSGYIRLRAAPTTSAAEIGQLVPGMLVTHYPRTEVTADGYSWRRVESSGMTGWAALVGNRSWAEQFMPPAPAINSTDSGSTFWFLNPCEFAYVVLDGGRFNAKRDYNAKGHEGWDASVLWTTPGPYRVVAGQKGTVVGIRDHGKHTYGKHLLVQTEWHDGNGNEEVWVLWYCHLATWNPALKLGDAVEMGQWIGDAGDTGNATGLHLHLNVQKVGGGLAGYALADVVNPEDYMRAKPIEAPMELPVVEAPMELPVVEAPVEAPTPVEKPPEPAVVTIQLPEITLPAAMRGPMADILQAVAEAMKAGKETGGAVA